MGNRVGLARTQVLIENLKRELSLTTDTTINVGGINTAAQMTAGTGITTGTGTLVKHSAVTVGNIIYTSILIDLTGLNSGDAGDVIGVADTANCHFGQFTAAVNGTLLGGRMICLETPTTGEPDIDIYSNTVATLTEDAQHDASGTSVALLQPAADWTLAAGVSDRTITTMPAADTYLYLVSNNATNATYDAGRFLIEFWGYAA